MQFDEQQILNLSADVWTSVLGLQIGRTQGEPGSSEEKTWSACVTVSGDWRGAIVLECPESIARHAAAMLFASDGETTSQEEIEDALGELSEMLARKMRPLLPDSAKLSRPSILQDGSPDGMQDRDELTLVCEGRPVRIAVLEAEIDLAAK